MQVFSSQQSYGVQFTTPTFLDDNVTFAKRDCRTASTKSDPERYCALSWNSDKLLHQKARDSQNWRVLKFKS